MKPFEYDEDPRREEWHDRECCPFCGCDDYDDLYERKDGEVVGCTECVKRR